MLFQSLVRKPKYESIEVQIGDKLHVVEESGAEYTFIVTNFEYFGHRLHFRCNGYQGLNENGNPVMSGGDGLIDSVNSQITKLPINL